MSRDINPFGLRMPPELKAALEDACQRSGRSLNAEIVARLEGSFPQAIETQLLDSRREEHSKLRATHRAAMFELEQYRDRLQRGDTSPYGPEWLKEVIKQSENRVAMLERLMVRIEREVLELEGGEIEPADSYSAAVSRFEQRIADAQERIDALKKLSEAVKDQSEREAAMKGIAEIEGLISTWRAELEVAKRQQAKKPGIVLSQIQRLKEEMERGY